MHDKLLPAGGPGGGSRGSRPPRGADVRRSTDTSWSTSMTDTATPAADADEPTSDDVIDGEVIESPATEQGADA